MNTKDFTGIAGEMAEGHAMQLLKKYGLMDSNRVHILKIADIKPNPGQPRRIFDSESLLMLAESIKEYGVLQPLSVRKKSDGYELIAGERRMRASRLAGLEEVPCIIIGADERQSSIIAMIENIQRKDLDFFEEAEGIATLIRTFGLSQEEAARRVGMSQSAVANKLRLLRHSKDVAAAVREYGLTERHARALLRLDTEEERLAILRDIHEKNLNVAQTDEYISEMLNTETAAPTEQVIKAPKEEKTKSNIRTLFIFKDIRLFMNTVTRAVETMKRSGVEAFYDKEEDDLEIKLVIRIPKKTAAKMGAVQMG